MLDVYILVFTALSIATINALVINKPGDVNTVIEGQPEAVVDIKPAQNGAPLYPSTGKRQQEPRKGLNALKNQTNGNNNYQYRPRYYYAYTRGYYPRNKGYYRTNYHPDYGYYVPLLQYYKSQNPFTTRSPYRKKPIVRGSDVTKPSKVQQEIEGSSTVAPSSESNLLKYFLIAAGSFVGMAFLFALFVKLRSCFKKRTEEMKYSGKQIGIQYGKDISSFSGGFKCENSLKTNQVNSLKLKLTRAESKPPLPPLPPLPLLPGQIKMQQETDHADPIEETLE